jgi:flavorubredoxin
MNAGPQTQVDEIARDIFRMSTWVPDITEHGFTFNQFLLTGEEPFLFHTGQWQLFPQVSAAVNRVIPLEKLRWISFGHLEADECRTTGRPGCGSTRRRPLCSPVTC